MNNLYCLTLSRWPPVHFLGQISLEIYLLHDPVAKIAIFTLHLPQAMTPHTQTDYTLKKFIFLNAVSAGGLDNYFWLWISDTGALLFLPSFVALHQK